MDESLSRVEAGALPVSAGLVHVATYERTLHASLERAWENVLDWEHLPWLHRDAFASIEREDSGSWGWRARVGPRPAAEGRELRVELLVERELGRYVTRTLEGWGRGSEIWTRLSPLGADATRVEVTFHLADVPAEGRDSLGRSYLELYTKLWDEDEAMMRRRQAELDRSRVQDTPELSLGPLRALRKRLPICVELGGRRFRVLELAGELVAHAAACPHRLGPLDQVEPEEGRIRCPWHGYLFDLRSGHSADGRGLRLARPPRVEVDPAGGVRLLPA